METTAPGMIAPVGSETIPRNEVVDCANRAGRLVSRMADTKHACKILRTLMVMLLNKLVKTREGRARRYQTGVNTAALRRKHSRERCLTRIIVLLAVVVKHSQFC